MNRPATQHKRVPYPAYKPSGVEWLGDVPEYWEVKALKRTFKTLNGATPRSGDPEYWDGDILWATPDDLGSLNGSTLTATRRMITQEGYESCGVSLAPEGSLVLSTRAPIGHLAIAGVRLCTNQGCRSLVFRNDDDRHFFFYQIIAARPELQSLGQGSTFTELSRDRLTSVHLVTPPLVEQRSIAAFLDRETARIDALIEKKQRQIELLQEKRSALISHAVTKGLDPNAPMKDSGIEWLGEIPRHWEVKRLRFLVSEPLKYGANESAELDDPTLPRYIRITDVDENGRLREDTFKSLPEDVARPYLLKDGDLLLARSGATVGKSFYYEPSWGRAAYAGYLIRARFNPARMMPRFVNYFTNSQQYWQWLGSSFIQATIQNVSAEKYANLVVPVPPVEEQAQIVSYLDGKWKRLNDLLEKVSASIGQLMEYRTALISAAVTGKIDVRKEVS